MLVDPLFHILMGFATCFSICDKKNVNTLKKMISTSERCEKHLLLLEIYKRGSLKVCGNGTFFNQRHEKVSCILSPSERSE